MKYTLRKHECLKKKKYFDAIFANGNSVKEYPIRAIYIAFNLDIFPDTEPPKYTQVAFSVPKRRFKLAVDRNRIKRQMREAYRLNKHILNQPYAVIFVYLPKTKLDYELINKAMIANLNAINKQNEQELRL